MIGHHQAVRRDERPRPAGESHRRGTQVVEPLLLHFKAVSLFQLPLGWAGEQPHPFIGPKQAAADQNRSEGHAHSVTQHESSWFIVSKETGSARLRYGRGDIAYRRPPTIEGLPFEPAF